MVIVTPQMPVRLKGERESWRPTGGPGSSVRVCPRIIASNASFQKHPSLDSKLCHPPYG